MPARRTYAQHGDACAAAHALDVVGDRWAVPMIRELALGPKRFTELTAALHGITPAVLSARLRELEAAGVLEPMFLPPPARARAYRLTPWGKEFEPILQALGRWALGSPSRPAEGGLTPDGAVIAMRTIAGSGPPSTPITVDLNLSDDRTPAPTDASYHLHWATDGLDIHKLLDAPTGPDTLTCDSTRWAQLLFDPATEHTGAELPAGLSASTDEARYAARRLLAQFHQATAALEG